MKHIRFPRGVTPYLSITHLLAAISAPFQWCLDISEIQGFLLSCFVISTWFIEKLPIAPYVALVGLPQSGKTTTLRILNQLCRRSLLTSDITSASFYDACNWTTPTILIDETATAGDPRALFHLLRAGSTKGAVAIRKNKSFSAYGAKVVCWTQPPNDAALNSRCIFITLQETDRTNLLRVTDLRVQRHADHVRRMLQQYRFAHFNGLSLGRVPGDERLSSRSRDLYEALALPIADENIRRFLVYEFEVQQEFNREPLSPIQAAVLRSLDSYIHENPADPACANASLTQIVNLNLAAERELIRASPHEVGRVLTSVGLTDRKRTNAGYVLRLSLEMRKKIHELIRHYRVEVYCRVNRGLCELCAPRTNRQVCTNPPNRTEGSGPDLIETQKE